MRVLFILHGAKRKLRAFPKKINEVRPQHIQFYYCFTSEFGSGKQIAYDNAHKADVITVIGGDGLLNECLNGIMMYKKDNPTAQPPSLTLLPFGSGNDFARMMGWKKKSIPDLIQKLQTPNYQDFDVGCIQYGTGRLEYFLNEVSTGLPTKVVERVEKMPAFLSGDIKFGWAIVECFLSFKKKPMQVRSKEFEWQGNAMLVVCSNGKYFGSGIAIAPEASMTDGIMEITIVGNVSIWDYLKNLSKLRKGVKLNHPEVRYYQTAKAQINGQWKVEKDGELGSKMPCEITVTDKIRILT